MNCQYYQDPFYTLRRNTDLKMDYIDWANVMFCQYNDKFLFFRYITTHNEQGIVALNISLETVRSSLVEHGHTFVEFHSLENYYPSVLFFCQNMRSIIDTIEFVKYGHYIIHTKNDLHYSMSRTIYGDKMYDFLNLVRTTKQRVRILKKRILIKLVFFAIFRNVLHKRYMPGNPGYITAKEDFEKANT